MSILLSIYKCCVRIGFGRFAEAKVFTCFSLTSQILVKPLTRVSSNIDLVNYNFVRCNLEAFGKKVTSRPGIEMNTLSSRVKMSEWFQGISTLPTSF